MYDVKPNLIIVFHGCERHVRDAFPENKDLKYDPHNYAKRGSGFCKLVGS